MIWGGHGGQNFGRSIGRARMNYDRWFMRRSRGGY